MAPMALTDSVGEPKRVLIVDDHAGVRAFLRRLLESWGYACAEAEDGITALDYASAHEVALLVTDLDMPGLDGIGLIQRLQELRRQREGPPVPVILLTGSAADGIPAVVEAMDIFAILPKPIDTVGLRALVTQILPRTEAVDTRDSLGGGMPSTTGPLAL
jgi:two-component system, chemotaxis family, chemotaxis protein CheY